MTKTAIVTVCKYGSVFANIVLMEKIMTQSVDNFGNPVFNQYLKRMGQISLLKREDEIEVARRISDLGSDSELAKQTLINANLVDDL